MRKLIRNSCLVISLAIASSAFAGDANVVVNTGQPAGNATIPIPTVQTTTTTTTRPAGCEAAHQGQDGKSTGGAAAFVLMLMPLVVASVAGKRFRYSAR